MVIMNIQGFKFPSLKLPLVTIVKRNKSLCYSMCFLFYSSKASRATVPVMTLMHNRKHTGLGGTEEHRKEVQGAV